MISKERIAQMFENWGNETNEAWTEEWREELTDEEATLVDKWDAGCILNKL